MESEKLSACIREMPHTKEESHFPSHAGLIWVYHVRDRYSHDDPDKSLRSCGNGNRFCADFCGRNFAEDSITDWPNRKVKDAIPDNLGEMSMLAVASQVNNLLQEYSLPEV
jgi:hypothetical protein